MKKKIEIPNKDIHPEEISKILQNASLQQRGSGYFREAIRFYHWPSGKVHQESIETDNLYKKLSFVTAKLLASFDDDTVCGLVFKYVKDFFQTIKQDVYSTNILNICRPIVLKVLYELVFKREITSYQYNIYLQATENFHNTVKGTTLRSCAKRKKLYKDLLKQIEELTCLDPLYELLTIFPDKKILALHLTTVIFYTGIIQSTECTSHTLIAAAQNPYVMEKLISFSKTLSTFPSWKLIENNDYLDFTLKESLRLYPLFGIAVREVSEKTIINGNQLDRGTQVLLNFLKCHTMYWDRPYEFRPERWDERLSDASSLELRKKQYIPFGTGTRSCPAKKFSITFNKSMITAILHYIRIEVPDNYIHTGRMPYGAPIVIMKSNVETNREKYFISENYMKDLLKDLEKNTPPPAS